MKSSLSEIAVQKIHAVLKNLFLSCTNNPIWLTCES